MFAVGFDFDHTLALDNKLEKVALVRTLSAQLAAHSDGDARIDVALTRYRSGAMSLADSLARLYAELGADARSFDEFFADFTAEALRLAPEHVEPVAGARELLARLEAAGVPTAILTNGWNPLQQRKAECFGYTGAVIVSDDLGIRKPDRRAFEVLARALETDIANVLYVGDSQTADVVGALGAGMQAIWFNWEGQTYDQSLAQPSAVIGSLDEVDALVLSRR